MTHSGRCYCGDLAYEFDGPIQSQLLCHCRECRYLSGGLANASVVISEANFRWTKGTPETFQRDDLATPRVRYFCANCGTHVCVKSPPRPGMLVLKVGTLDDDTWFKPETAIFCIDQQPFHILPEGVASFERLPPPK
jgi:hypothetical protein